MLLESLDGVCFSWCLFCFKKYMKERESLGTWAHSQAGTRTPMHTHKCTKGHPCPCTLLKSPASQMSEKPGKLDPQGPGRLAYPLPGQMRQWLLSCHLYTQSPSQTFLLLSVTFWAPQLYPVSKPSFIAMKEGLSMHNVIIWLLHACYIVDYTSTYTFWTNSRSVGIFIVSVWNSYFA